MMINKNANVKPDSKFTTWSLQKATKKRITIEKTPKVTKAIRPFSAKENIFFIVVGIKLKIPFRPFGLISTGTHLCTEEECP